MMKTKLKSFQINEFLSLVLKNDETIIYVNRRPFFQCKYLFLVNPERPPNKNVRSIGSNLSILFFYLKSSITQGILDLSLGRKSDNT